MKAQLLKLSAAGLVLAAAGAATAGPSEVQAYVQQAGVQAQARLAQASVPLEGPGVAVRATVAGDGRLEGLRVVRSSGSLATDQSVQQALRRLWVGEAPPELAGRQITLTLGAQPIVQAKAP